MKRPWPDAPPGALGTTDRIADAAAWLTNHELIVRHGPAVWAASHLMVDEPIVATIRESGVVCLAVSTAVHPALLTVNTLGKGVECGLLYGPGGTGKTNMLLLIDDAQ